MSDQLHLRRVKAPPRQGWDFWRGGPKHSRRGRAPPPAQVGSFRGVDWPHQGGVRQRPTPRLGHFAGWVSGTSPRPFSDFPRPGGGVRHRWTPRLGLFTGWTSPTQAGVRHRPSTRRWRLFACWTSHTQAGLRQRPTPTFGLLAGWTSRKQWGKAVPDAQFQTFR